MKRPDSRSSTTPRPVEVIAHFHRHAEGSVLYRAGSTTVLVTASVDSKVPPFLEGKNKGWLTAEYQMHPRANAEKREARDGRGKAPSGRTLEIQRLVGRALRAAVNLERLGARTITIDCDVLEADGGTRTASVTGGFIALALAVHRLTRQGVLSSAVLREPIAAISVGLLGDDLALDLIYQEDSKADVDLNVVATGSGAIVEIQGTAETAPVPRKRIDAMVDLALAGISDLCVMQKETLGRAGVDLAELTVPPQSGGTNMTRGAT